MTIEARALRTLLLLLGLCCSAPLHAQNAPCAPKASYGSNATAGRYANVNGIRLYYEVYGDGPALVLMHANASSIVEMSCQIAYFMPNHRVIAVDARGRGRSKDGTAPFTFEQQADDLAALLDHEHIDKADLLGQSDGAIIALVTGLRHPDKVRKIVASAPNLWPDNTALFQEVLDAMKEEVADADKRIAAGDTRYDWRRYKRQVEQDLREPHVTPAQIRTIVAPVLLIGAEQDAIKESHYREILRYLPHGELVILPGTTHNGLIRSPQFNPRASRFLAN